MPAAAPVVYQLWGGMQPMAWQRKAWDRRDELWGPGTPDEALFAGGPRSGKDIVTTALNLYGLLQLHVERKAAGSILTPLVHSWVIAPTSDDYEQVWREYVRSIQGLNVEIRRAQGSQCIWLEASDPKDLDGTGILIEFKSGWQPDRLVGAGPDSMHVTEAAKLPEESWNKLDDRRASPGRRSIVIANGTPTQRPGKRYRELYRAGKAGDPNLIFYNVPTWDNTQLGDEELARLVRIKRRVSDRRWRANQGAELVPEGAGLFRYLDRICTGKPRDPVRGRYYYKGLDLGRTNDWTTLGAFYITRDGRLVQVALDGWSDADWQRQEDRITAFCKRYPGELHVDATARISSVDRIMLRLPHELVTPWVQSPRLKEEQVDHAVNLGETGQLLLLRPEPTSVADEDAIARRQKQELQDFGEMKTKLGNTRFDSLEGGHDDFVDEVLLACWGVRGVLDQSGWDAINQATGVR